MAKEESKLVEAVEETTATETQEAESDDKFNPLAFTSDVPLNNENTETETDTETKEEASSDDENAVESKEESQDEEGWAWNKDEDAKDNSTEEEYNWEGTADTSEEKPQETKSEINWIDVSKELGIEGASKEEIVNALNTLAQKQEPSSDAQIIQLKNYLSFNDRDLVGEELKADGMDAAEISESLDKLEDSGMLKIKAKEVRRVINNAITQQQTNNKQKAEQEMATQKANAEKAKKELQNTIKDMSEFMGGKVTKKQKEEIYRYATGKMMNDIYSSHANVADVAMFMLYRKQIEKILRSQGLEDGKAAIMNSIVSPNLNTGKSKPNFKVKSGKFDPKAFMTE